MNNLTVGIGFSKKNRRSRHFFHSGEGFCVVISLTSENGVFMNGKRGVHEGTVPVPEKRSFKDNVCFYVKVYLVLLEGFFSSSRKLAVVGM